MAGGGSRVSAPRASDIKIDIRNSKPKEKRGTTEEEEEEEEEEEREREREKTKRGSQLEQLSHIISK
jgi:hypothetical protein